MPFPPDTSILLHRRFDDFDEMAVAARHWDIDFAQLDRGRFQGEVVQVVSGGVLFSEGRFGRTLTQQGVAPRGMRSFVVPAGTNVHFKWRGKDIGANDLLAFPRNGELYAISNSAFHVYTISLPEELLEAAARAADVPRFCEILRRERVSCSPAILNPIRQRLSDISRAAKRDRRRSGEMSALGDLQREIPQLVVRAMAVASASTDAKPVRKRDHAVRRANAFISEFRNWPLSVRHLCEAIGVSERTLQYAFLEHFGVTPRLYVRAFRLNKVRRELRRSNPDDTKISEVAGRWGFWHMGQFAADYRTQFGELPSQTLASPNVAG